MIVRRCPDCGLKYDYPHGEPDPHDCKGTKANPFAAAYAEAIANPNKAPGWTEGTLYKDGEFPDWTEGKTYNDGDKITMASGEKATAKPIKPGWSEERRAAQRAKMNEWHRKQAEARAAARAKVEEETFNVLKSTT